MASVTGLTADRMLAIEAESIVQGVVDATSGDLILTRHDGTQINAGHVKGVTGDPGHDATAVFQGSNSNTIQPHITGTGTPSDPWLFGADVVAIPDGAMIKGVLDPKYYGYGPAKVKVNGVLSATAYEWLTPYNPSASRTVRLMKTGTTYLITGQTQEGYYDLLQTINAAAWTTYMDSAVTQTFNERARAIKLPSGLVVLSGLLRAKGAAALGSVIATLPAGYAPDTDQLIGVEMNDQSLFIYVRANGNIEAGTSFVSSGYLSLDGVAYWAAGVPQWTDFGSGGSTWGANYDYDPAYVSQFGLPGFWKDPYGFVWFRGLVRLKGTGADNQPILTLPAGYGSNKGQHFRTASSSGFGIAGTVGNNLVNKAGNPTAAGAWISLCGFCIATPDALANNPWTVPSAFANSWVNYDPAANNYQTCAIVRREDGLCMTIGLMGSGTVGQRMFSMARTEYWPAGARIIVAGVATNAHARIDISGFREVSSGYEPGGFNMIQGTNSWFSIDSKMWVP